MATTQFLGSKYKSFKNDGTINASGTVEFFVTGGTFSTYMTSYADSGLTISNSNTITLDSAGEADIWLGGVADVRIRTSAGATVDTFLNWNPTAGASDATSYNSITNFSFEGGLDGAGQPIGWTVVPYSTGAFSLDATSSAHGANALKFVSVGAGGGVVTTATNFPVSPSEPYVLSWRMKSSVVDVRNQVQVLWYKADGSPSATPSVDLYDNSTTNPVVFTVQAVTSTPPADTYYAKVRFTGAHSSDPTAGSTWFDDVQFLQGRMYGDRIFANGVTVLGATALSGTVSIAGTVTMVAKALLNAQATVAAATTTQVLSAEGNSILMTGGAPITITSFGTSRQAGAQYHVTSTGAGAHIITHNAVSLINESVGNITVAQGDSWWVEDLGSNNCRLHGYVRADGTALVPNINRQEFNTAGAATWTKPAGYPATSIAILEAWAGGGGGGRGNAGAFSPGGGGGGGYSIREVLLSTMGATEALSVGAAGIGAPATGNGGTGGNTTIGSLLTAYGGGGGGGHPTEISAGGGGGGDFGAGASAAGSIAGIGGIGIGGLGGGTGGAPSTAGGRPNSPYGGAGGGGAAADGAKAHWGGGGGAGGNAATFGGTSINGGKGGDNGSGGFQPGGGGGGNHSLPGADGGVGRVRITVYRP